MTQDGAPLCQTFKGANRRHWNRVEQVNKLYQRDERGLAYLLTLRHLSGQRGKSIDVNAIRKWMNNDSTLPDCFNSMYLCQY
jgi:hypothetical protein